MSDLMQASPLVRLRQAAVGKAIEVTLSSVSAGARYWHPKAQPWRQGVDVARDIEYGQGKAGRLRLDIYRPRGAQGPLPVLFYVHGGGFRILSKDSHWMFGCGYAQRGFVVVNIDYTLSRVAPFPAAAQDTFAAWLWTLQNIGQYGGDPTTVVVGGESAGGNLVTSLLIAACWRRPEPWARAVFDAGVVPHAAIPACGFLQVSQPERYLQNEAIPTWMRDRIADICRSYLPLDAGSGDAIALADPLVHLEGGSEPARPLPPFFVPCGTKDPVLEDSMRLERALQRRGVDVDARWYEGGIHAFHAFVWSELGRRCWADQDQFLARVLLR